MQQDDRNTLNPAGAARRRLLKAAGLGAVAAGLSLDWRTPRVRLGALPTHAQATIADCTVGYTLNLVNLDPSGQSAMAALGLSDSNGSSTLASTIIYDTTSTHQISASTTQGPSETYSWIYLFTVPGSALSGSFSAECCTDSLSTAVGQVNGTNSVLLYNTVTGDPGTCSIEPGEV